MMVILKRLDTGKDIAINPDFVVLAGVDNNGQDTLVEVRSGNGNYVFEVEGSFLEVVNKLNGGTNAGRSTDRA